MKGIKLITLLLLSASLSSCTLNIMGDSLTSGQQSSQTQTSQEGASSEGSNSSSTSSTKESSEGTSSSETQTSSGSSTSESQTAPTGEKGKTVTNPYTIEEMIDVMGNYQAGQESTEDYYVTGKAVSSYYDQTHKSFTCYFESHELDDQAPFQLYSGVLSNSLGSSYNDLTNKTLVFHGRAYLFNKNGTLIYEIAYVGSGSKTNPVIDLVDGKGGSSSGETSEPTSESSSSTSSSTSSNTSEGSGEDYSGSSLDGDPIATDPVAQEYYKGISKTSSGDDLRRELHSLVSKNRCSTGYKALWGYYPYCDANPDKPEEDSVVAFYDGTAEKNYSSTMNKEHVWPNSRGGNLVEGDPHMTRPTYSKDNSSRGNSFYVEGIAHSQNGWDPKTAGMNENFRGDSARIIFYAAVANMSLNLVDKTNDSTGNQTMGKLSDLIKWNYEYPVSKYERLRNEVLSGERSVKGSNYKFNRNPFIDDRTYVCRIWGDTNSETQRLCKLYTQKVTPTSITLSDTNVTLTNFEEYQLSVKNVAPAGASETVKWTSSDTSVVTVGATGTLKAVKNGNAVITATSTADDKVKATCNVTVEIADIELESISAQPSLTVNVGSYSQIKVTNNPSNAYPAPTYTYESANTNVATVDASGVVSGVNKGNTSINVTARQGEIVKYAEVQVNVTASSGLTKVVTAPSNWAGQYLIVNEEKAKAFNSGASNLDSSENAISVTINGSSIVLTEALRDALVTVEQVGSQYVLKTSDGQVIKSGGDKGKNVLIDETGATKATFTMNGTDVKITCGSSYTIQYNQSASMFRFYNTQQLPVALYRLS